MVEPVHGVDQLVARLPLLDTLCVFAVRCRGNESPPKGGRTKWPPVDAMRRMREQTTNVRGSLVPSEACEGRRVSEQADHLRPLNGVLAVLA
jgi:hypothetical protein